MKTLDQQMTVYAAYHRDLRNKLTHFVGVPMIMFAVLVAFGWARLPIGGFDLSLAYALSIVVLAYYFALDRPLAVAMTVVVGLLLWGSETVVAAGFATSLTAFLVTFIVGWIIQLVGHYFEGRKPALVDNLFQILVAPIFLMAEVFFALGFKRDVLARVEHALKLQA